MGLIPGIELDQVADACAKTTPWASGIIGAYIALNAVSYVMDHISVWTKRWKGDDAFAARLRTLVQVLRVVIDLFILKRRPEPPAEPKPEAKEVPGVALVGIPDVTIKVLDAIAKKTGKTMAAVLSESIDQRAKVVLGDDYAQHIDGGEDSSG